MLDLLKFNSVPDMLFNSVTMYSDKNALMYKKNGSYTGITYHELGETVTNLAFGLLSQKINPDNKIAILADSCHQWAITDFASLCIQGVVVPIYPSQSAEQIQYILKDSESRVVFIDTKDQFDKLIKIKSNLPKLEYIFTLFDLEFNDSKILSYNTLIENGKLLREKNPDLVSSLIKGIDNTNVCSIVYTSGTTGEPKGVMLTNKGFVIDIVSCESVLNLVTDDVFLSHLPLSHLYERAAGHWDPLYRGCTIYYAESLKTVVGDMALARPTVMVSVPRLYEKIAQSVKDQINQGSKLKKKIFAWALKVGEKHTEKKQTGNGNIGKILAFKYSIADKLVFQKIKASLGGRLRSPISGGSPITIDTLKLFEAMGLKIADGYGMTEAHLIITLTDAIESVYGSCGRPIPGVEIKINDNGEVLVRGETIMKGYYNKPELTREAIDDQGWLHTGDIGYLNDQNYLFLTDRIKNIIITSGGKNIAPTPIENAIKSSKYIDDACLVGDQRKFISALIIPDYAAITKWGESIGLKFNNNKELVENPEVYKLIWNEIENLQNDFARVEKIKKITILSDPFSMERGELTASLKIKRKVVQERYKPMIDLMYAE